MRIWMVALLLSLASTPARAAPGKKLSLHLEGADLHGVARLIAEASGRNLVVAGSLEGLLDGDHRKLSPMALPELLAGDAVAVMTLHRNRVVVPKALLEQWPAQPRRVQKFRGKKVTLAFDRAEVISVLNLLAEVSGAELRVDPELRGEVTVFVRDQPWDQVLPTIMASLGRGVRSRGRATAPGQRVIEIAPFGAKLGTPGLIPLPPPPPPPVTPEPSRSYQTPLERWDLEEVRVVGLLLGGRTPLGLIRVGDGRTFVARVGEIVGWDRARILAIDEAGVSTRSEVRLGTGELKVTESRLLLRPPAKAPAGSSASP